MTKLHLDTDLGGDIDDLCALAMLLKWPDLEITGITTVAEENGRRAGYVKQALELAGRADIPVAAGVDVSSGAYCYQSLGYPEDERYWLREVAPSYTPAEEALDLIASSVEQGAIIVGIGPYTNLALLDKRHPGALATARLVLMGGFIHPIPPGYPPWDNGMDWNIQTDVRSAHYVLEQANPLLVPLTVSVQTALRRSYLPGLRASGNLGELIATQAEAFAEDHHNEERLGRICQDLPDDTINFQHDPLACAVALGWDGARIEEMPLRFEIEAGWLVERIAAGGKKTRVVTEVAGEAFGEFWYDVVTG